MTADRGTNTGLEPRKAPMGDGGMGVNRGPAPQAADPEADARFKQSIADLSRRLGERAAQQATVDPKAEVAARRAAMRSYFSSRARLKMLAGTAAAAVAAASIAWVVVMIAAPEPSSPTVAARPERPAPVETADVTAPPVPPFSQAPSPAEPPSLATSMASIDAPPPVRPTPTPLAPPANAATVSPLQPVVGTAPPARATATDSATIATPASPASTTPSDSGQGSTSLGLDEVREVQGRLRSFGFNPGPVDGTAGPMTQAAIMHYQQKRGLQQTGQVDRDLLEQLRRDPAPQVAVRPDPPRYARAGGSRSADPFAPLQQIGDSITRWFQSIGH